MSDLAMIALLVALGPGFLAWGIWSLRKGAWRQSVPLAEYLIDRAVGVDPPPRNVWDRRFALFQAWMMTLFGGLVSLGIIALLYSQFAQE